MVDFKGTNELTKAISPITRPINNPYKIVALSTVTWINDYLKKQFAVIFPSGWLYLQLCFFPYNGNENIGVVPK